MTEQDFGTIAALDFCVPPRQGFDDIVEELDIAFRPEGTRRRALTWEADDIAVIERDAVRLLLGWVDTGRADGSHFLVLGVGQSAAEPEIHVGPESCRYIKTILMAHLESYLSYTELLHVDTAQPLTGDLVDMVAEILRCQTTLQARTTRSQNNPLSEEALRKALDDDMIIEPAAPDECSLPQRLTIYALGATMLLYTPPVGASLLLYSTLRDFAPKELPRLQARAA